MHHGAELAVVDTRYIRRASADAVSDATPRLQECIVGFGNQETPEAMAAFVEYAYGDSSTHWGALRIADGHPQ